MKTRLGPINLVCYAGQSNAGGAGGNGLTGAAGIGGAGGSGRLMLGDAVIAKLG